MFDLIRAALRQRPRVIIVGEVRGKEANTLFQAMATGHISYSTVHASDMHELLQRLENSPISLPRALLTSLDMVVFLNSVNVGEKPVRRVSKVVEIIKLDASSNRLVYMTPFSWISEIDDRFKREEKSIILGKIKEKKGWNDERLDQELKNRIKVLDWMQQKNLRSYKAVGKIVSEYSKDPDAVLKKIRESSG
jgi:flagellar protein FlaI